MTKVICLWGGPGTGKSTCASDLFARLKKAGVNAEVVGEVAKDYAWEGRTITALHQPVLLGAQCEREVRLYGKVDVLVTDAPILLSPFYQYKFNLGDDYTLATALGFTAAAEAQGVSYEHYFLKRSKAYNPAGRFQTEAQAHTIDREIPYYFKLRNLPKSTLIEGPEHAAEIFDLIIPHY